MRRPRAHTLVGAALGALLLAVIAFDQIWGGGHPSLTAVLLFWAILPTLTGYLSRALLGLDFPPLPIALVSLLEYPFVILGVVSALRRPHVRSARLATIGIVLVVAYVGAHATARIVLNLQSVNLRLVTHPNQAVASAAVDRLRGSGDEAAIPVLQQCLLELHARQGWVDNNTLDTLTSLGGTRGWEELLNSGRLSVAGPDARTWRAIVQSVREMSGNPYYAEARGGVKTDHLGEHDVAQLFAALARALSAHLGTAADGEAALTLMAIIKGRPDLCAMHLAVVPNGLRDKTAQAASDLVAVLTMAKAGPATDGNYDRQAALVRNEQTRLYAERDAVFNEWSEWAKSPTALCR